MNLDDANQRPYPATNPPPAQSAAILLLPIVTFFSTVQLYPRIDTVNS